jgi:hypothetical protein
MQILDYDSGPHNGRYGSYTQIPALANGENVHVGCTWRHFVHPDTIFYGVQRYVGQAVQTLYMCLTEAIYVDLKNLLYDLCRDDI